MIKFETTPEKEQKISIEFGKFTDIETIGNYRNALIGAIKCISLSDDVLTYQDDCYYLANLLQAFEFSYEQQTNLAICERLNEERINKLRDIMFKIKHEPQKMKEEEKKLAKEWIKD